MTHHHDVQVAVAASEAAREQRSQIYLNGAFFTADDRRWAQALVVRGRHIAYVGDTDTARRIAGPDAEETDLDGALVLPGFVDGHVHMLGTGALALQVDLTGATSLQEIQRRLAAYVESNPDVPRVRAHGWLHSAIGGHPDRQMLDEVISDRPVYANSSDFHAVWMNSAGLKELGLTSAVQDPPGGSYGRDDDGELTGYVDETAVHYQVWPMIAEVAEGDAERDEFLEQALAGYRSCGVTTTVDMGLEPLMIDAMERAQAAGTLTGRIIGHWMMNPSDDPEHNMAQVRQVIEAARAHTSDRFRVTGLKLVLDGTIDGCTATVGKPYVDGSQPPPIWSRELAMPVVLAADAAGLQVAMHAIGDEAVRIAIDCIEEAVRVNGPKIRRHRIEHLEVVDHADIERLAALGITASMQPVHADPAILDNWNAMLGHDERTDRGFPWPEMTEAGAKLAFGSDSPTAPANPFANMFIAATRRSAFDPSREPNIEKYKLPLAQAIVHATSDSAWACFAQDQVGRLAAGLLADFVVVDRNIFERPVEELLEASVTRTVVGGETVFEV